MPQLLLLSKNKRRTQRIVVEVESRGGNPLESCTHRPSSTWCKEGQHKHKRPPGDGSRTTPDAGKSSSPHDDHRRGNIVVPTSTPSAAAATAAVCRIKLPQRQDAIPSRPVLLKSVVVRGRGKLIKKITLGVRTAGVVNSGRCQGRIRLRPALNGRLRKKADNSNGRQCTVNGSTQRQMSAEMLAAEMLASEMSGDGR